MLLASHLTLWRGDTCLFSDLSFGVEPGSALVVRGRNGVGKTTLLRVLCGLTRPECGEVRWQGGPVPPGLRGQVAYSGHLPALHPDLTVRQNLQFFRRLVSPARPDWTTLMEQLDIGKVADLEVRHLSAGQKRRTALVRVLMSGAPLWLLDEPFTNMDNTGRNLVESLIGKHVDGGGSAVIVAHDQMQVSTTRISVLELGGNTA
jgi:heme exporter protein A